jgi:hypothetical protein
MVVFPMQTYFDSDAASAWLTARGVKRSTKTLRKLRCVGGGPAFRHLNGRPYYTEADLQQWLDERLGPPVRSTSELPHRARRHPITAAAEEAAR